MVKYYTLIVLILFLMISCRSPINSIDNEKQLTEIKLADRVLLSTLSLYSQKRMKDQNKGLIVVYSKDIVDKNSTKYINHIYGLSKIYLKPISSFLIYNNDTILIYSKKHRFLNPRNYNSSFIKSMKLSLEDDWTLMEEKDGSLQFLNSFMNHSIPWKLENGKKLDTLLNKSPSMSKFMYGEKSFNYINYDNLDSLRIVRYNKTN